MQTQKVERRNAVKIIHYESNGQVDSLAVDEILAGGRGPNVEGLNLEAVGVEYDKGVVVNDRLYTTNLAFTWLEMSACNLNSPMLLPADPELSVPWQKKLSTLTMPGARILIRNCSVGLYEKDAQEKELM